MVGVLSPGRRTSPWIPDNHLQPCGKTGFSPTHAPWAWRPAVYLRYRPATGLEAAVVDHSPQRIAALDPADTRAFDVSVAGVASLMIAKLHKKDVVERRQDKDGLDVAHAVCSNTATGFTCSCSAGFTDDGGVCDACSVCPESTYASSSCTATSDTVCTECEEHCTACTGPGACTGCKDGYSLVSGVCVQD